jgi:hypothetical protein
MSAEHDESVEREARIRKRAHAIWEREGRPHGKEKAHWEQALLEESAEDGHAEPDTVTKQNALKRIPSGQAQRSNR